MGGARLHFSGQRLVDRVVEAPGEGLAVLPAGDEDGGWPRLAGRNLRLPGAVVPAEFEWLSVHAGCFQSGRLGGVESGWLARIVLRVQTPREHVTLPVDGGDPAADACGLHVLLVPVVRPDGLAARFPGPYVAFLVNDHGLVLVDGEPSGFHAFRQAETCGTGGAVGQVIGLPVRVQKEEPLVEGLGLDDAHARVLLDAFRLGFYRVGRVPDPGLPVRVHDEGPAAGGGVGDGLCLSG